MRPLRLGQDQRVATFTRGTCTRKTGPAVDSSGMNGALLAGLMRCTKK